MTDSEKLDLLLKEVGNLKADIKTIDSRLDQVDSRLDQMDSRFNVIELKQDRTAKKLDDLQLDVKIAERNISRDIHILNDEMGTVIEVLRLHELLPKRA